MCGGGNGCVVVVMGVWLWACGGSKPYCGGCYRRRGVCGDGYGQRGGCGGYGQREGCDGGCGQTVGCGGGCGQRVGCRLGGLNSRCGRKQHDQYQCHC